MAFQEYPKWIESPGSTPENRKGIVVQNKAEEEALLKKMRPIAPPPNPPEMAGVGITQPESAEAPKPIKPFGKK